MVYQEVYDSFSFNLSSCLQLIILPPETNEKFKELSPSDG